MEDIKAAEDSGTPEEPDRNKVMVFGKNVGEIPCFRNSFLYGITGGFGTGIAYFAFTSKIRAATNAAVWTYGGITLVYWFYCRYDYSVTSFKYRQIKHALKYNAAYEGTEKEIVYHTPEALESTKSSSPKVDKDTDNNKIIIPEIVKS